MAKLGVLLTSTALMCLAQNPTSSAPKNTTIAQPARTNQQGALTTAQIAKKVSPSVVVIQGKTDSGHVLGSGFLVSKDGKIVTNLHVIRDMKTANVQLANGKTFDSVSVLGTDEDHDLAIVQIASFDLPVLDLGNSDVLTVGEPLVIVGSPRGLEGTVTAGILSSVRDLGDGFKVLQTDATVNPGNSGGPLVNNRGQAVGVVSFKLRSAEGVNFAVPIKYVRGLQGNLQKPMSLEQMRKTLAPPVHGSQGYSELTGKVFAITKGGDLKPARMATLFVLSGDAAAQFKSNMLSETSRAAEAAKTDSGLVDPMVAGDFSELLESLKRRYCRDAFVSTFEEAVNLAKRNPDSIVTSETDEDGIFRVTGLTSGTRTVVAIGRAGSNDAVWVEDVTLESGQETPIRMHTPSMACPDR